MPITPTYPGVYIEEIPSGVRTIVGVATSITAFVGRALWGTVNEPLRIQNYGEYERLFGGLWRASSMSYAVQQFFLNGGTDALIVRLVPTDALSASVDVNGLLLDAENEGEWGNTLRATTDLDTADTSDTNLFNLTIQRLSGTTITDNVVATETFRNVSIDPNSPRFVTNVLANRSSYARVNTLPGALIAGSAMFVGGDDGTVLTATEYEGSLVNRTGIYALEKADLFNILCIPPFTLDASTDTTPWDDALAYCKQRRAMLIVNPHPDWTTPDDVADDSNNNTTGIFNHRDENSVMYFPRLRMPDSLQENRLAEFVPCGVMAGVMARTDAQRGVWKAPAGIDASLVGVRELSYKMTDGDNGKINPIGVNALRTFPVIGNVGWGARTLEGADRLASEWKYVPVRRLALFIEESLYRGTQWVVFEPNDEPLWAQIRLNIGAFMHNLFRQGAFQGSSPRDAYFVKCDSSTTTQNDIDQGIVNILVGFAPLKPAEFVMIKISQIAGNIEF